MANEIELEHRLTVIEEDIKAIKADTQVLKSDLREIKESLKWPFRAVSVAAITAVVGWIFTVVTR
jgi:hypothetical protein